MKAMRFATISAAAFVLILVAAPLARAGAPAPLRILLTNDDGFDSPGIQAMRAALLGAGHDVTVVAPLENQSGTGGSLNTDVGSFVDVIEEEPGVWSVDSTPSDAVRAALGAVLAGSPPDLIVSGANFGQNLAQPATIGSGTVGAALTGLYGGVPAIAVSVGLDLAEAPIGFPSTFAAFAPTADFTVRLIRRLQETSHGELLPPRTMLNVNVPVPFEAIQGVKVNRLARQGDIAFVWQDVLGVIPSGGGPVLINIALPPGPDPVPNNDTDAFRDGFLSIGVIDGDMTAGPVHRFHVALRLHGLAP